MSDQSIADEHPATLDSTWGMLTHLVCASQDRDRGSLGPAALHLNAVQNALDAGEGGPDRRFAIARLRRQRRLLAEASFAPRS